VTKERKKRRERERREREIGSERRTYTCSDVADNIRMLRIFHQFERDAEKTKRVTHTQTQTETHTEKER
jgi:hypothetical protein